MAQPRPSCTLILDIDERLFSEEVKLEVGRCYSYVCTTLVRTHPASDGEPVNTARILAKLGTRKYVHSSDEGADELWSDVMERWLHNEFHKIGNNLVIYNRRQREIGGVELNFDWLEVELENGALTLAWRLDSTSFIDPERSALASQVRALLNGGALGEGVVRVGRVRPIGQRAENAYVLTLNRFHERFHGGVGAALVHPVAQQHGVAVQFGRACREVVELFGIDSHGVENAFRQAAGAAGQAAVNDLYFHGLFLSQDSVSRYAPMCSSI